MNQFLDPRSKVCFPSGKVKLYGLDMTHLRRACFRRAEGRCEYCNSRGRWCNVRAPWDGIGHGELHHDPSGIQQSDEIDKVRWFCRKHHRERHPGVQWTRRAA